MMEDEIFDLAKKFEEFYFQAERSMGEHFSHIFVKSGKCILKKNLSLESNSFQIVFDDESGLNEFIKNNKTDKSDYEKYLTKLKCREDNFLKWLDENPHYRVALEAFLGKAFVRAIDSIPQEIYEYSDLEPITIQNLFDVYIARIIGHYSQILKNGAEYYKAPDYEYLHKVEKTSKELVGLIQNSPASISDDLFENLPLQLERLCEEIECVVRNRKTSFGHNSRFLTLNKNHAKAERELFTKITSYEYTVCLSSSASFGSNYRFVNSCGPIQAKQTFDSKVVPHRQSKNLDNSIAPKLQSDGRFSHGVIHPSIIVNLITMITGDADITERKVYKLWDSFKENKDRLYMADGSPMVVTIPSRYDT